MDQNKIKVSNPILSYLSTIVNQPQKKLKTNNGLLFLFYCLQNRRGGASLMAKAAISYVRALYSLAVKHFNGSGWKSDKDFHANVALCARAAFLGQIDALCELGHCLQDGYSVQRTSPIGGASSSWPTSVISPLGCHPTPPLRTGWGRWGEESCIGEEDFRTGNEGCRLHKTRKWKTKNVSIWTVRYIQWLIFGWLYECSIPNLHPKKSYTIIVYL